MTVSTQLIDRRSVFSALSYICSHGSALNTVSPVNAKQREMLATSKDMSAFQVRDNHRHFLAVLQNRVISGDMLDKNFVLGNGLLRAFGGVSSDSSSSKFVFIRSVNLSLFPTENQQLNKWDLFGSSDGIMLSQVSGYLSLPTELVSLADVAACMGTRGHDSAQFEFPKHRTRVGSSVDPEKPEEHSGSSVAINKDHLSVFPVKGRACEGLIEFPRTGASSIYGVAFIVTKDQSNV